MADVVGAHLLAGLVDDATPVVTAGSVLGILVGLVVLLIRQYSAQQTGWQTLSDAAWARVRELEDEVDKKQAELDRQADRARQCEADLDAARRTTADAQIVSVAKEGEVHMLTLQLDELRRQLAEARQTGGGT